MIRRDWTIPNILSSVRFLLIPVLWIFALLSMPVAIGIGMIVAGLTDATDGYAARKLNQVSDYGAKLDALADNILLPSTVIWLLMLRPEVYTDNVALFVAAVLAYVSSIFVGLVKHKRFANLHLFTSKVSGIILYIFIVHTLLFSEYEPLLTFVAIGLFILSSTETLLLQLAHSEVDENMGSIALVLLRRRRTTRTDSPT